MLTIGSGMVKVDFIFMGKLDQFRIDGVEILGSDVLRGGAHCSWLKICLRI